MNDIGVKICKCGTIHVIQSEKFINALNSNMNYLEICRNCGATTVMGDCNMLVEGNIERTFYDIELPNDRCSITIDDFNLLNGKKPFSEIYFSTGYRVPMMTGRYATCFKDNSFHDTSCSTTYKDESLTIKFDMLAKCVDMDRFIKETPDEILYAVSRLRISGINWTGTKNAALISVGGAAFFMSLILHYRRFLVGVFIKPVFPEVFVCLLYYHTAQQQQ